MTEAKCDSPDPACWTVSHSDVLEWTARPSAQRTEAAGRVITNQERSRVVRSGRERA